MMLRCSTVAALALFAGCSGANPYTVMISGNPAAKAAQCDFQVVAAMPQGNYKEIAVLTSNYGENDPAAFKERIRAEVCRVGGDIVVMDVVNHYGRINRGVVLRSGE